MTNLDQFLQEAKCLLVDDQETNLDLLSRILKRRGYCHIYQTEDPTRVVPMVKTLSPDIILLDLHMPEMDGFEVMAALRPVIPATTFLPILVLTADMRSESKQRALAEGARDFLVKPFDPIEVALRVKNLLETRMLYLDLSAENAVLEQKVRERTKELEAAKQEILRLLTRW
ncbi:MAG: two-component system response regulator [Sulfobacillus thermosulfidooxidans]|uniref:Stage 0 sporulation protein A homolog n=1 Tax=Sulfobacillus thermosulfidooxidans TaxID=28034 RepID=A0A2T2WTE2_SULTH|nr:MAG: two-component system response regulator [Sulfobacillus thermosulfidooxidans]